MTAIGNSIGRTSSQAGEGASGRRTWRRTAAGSDTGGMVANLAPPPPFPMRQPYIVYSTAAVAGLFAANVVAVTKRRRLFIALQSLMAVLPPCLLLPFYTFHLPTFQLACRDIPSDGQACLPRLTCDSPRCLEHPYRGNSYEGMPGWVCSMKGYDGGRFQHLGGRRMRVCSV